MNKLKYFVINESSTEESVKAQFREYSKRLHPDSKCTTASAESFAEMCTEYEALKNGGYLRFITGKSSSFTIDHDGIKINIAGNVTLDIDLRDAILFAFSPKKQAKPFLQKYSTQLIRAAEQTIRNNSKI